MKKTNKDNISMLTDAIIAEIARMKERDHENDGGFSINASYDEDDDSFDVDCVFHNDPTKTIMWSEGSAQEQVDALWNLDTGEAHHVADMMISEKWLENDQA